MVACCAHDRTRHVHHSAVRTASSSLLFPMMPQYCHENGYVINLRLQVTGMNQQAGHSKFCARLLPASILVPVQQSFRLLWFLEPLSTTMDRAKKARPGDTLQTGLHVGAALLPLHVD